jgi:hypothetical protein
MSLSLFAAVVIFGLLVAVAIKKMRPRRAKSVRRGVTGVGPAAAGAFYELLNEDRRKAIEIVIEEKAGYRDPEDADGNLPELQNPGARSVPRTP